VSNQVALAGASLPSPCRVTARCGSAYVCPSRGSGLRGGDRHAVTRAPTGSPELSSPSKVSPTRRVAPCWLPALPPRRLSTGLGVFLVGRAAEPRPRRSSLGVRLSFGACAASCPPPPVRPRPAPRERVETVLPIGGLPLLGSCSHERLDAGCPFFTVTARAAPTERRSPNLRPVPSSGFLPLSTVLAVLAARTSPFRSPPFVRRGTPTLRGLLSCRSRPWNCPPELSLPEKPYPLSRAACSLAGSRSIRRLRSAPEDFAELSPPRRPPAKDHPEVTRDDRGRDDGSLPR
jgi:hypothetical protein